MFWYEDEDKTIANGNRVLYNEKNDRRYSV